MYSRISIANDDKPKKEEEETKPKKGESKGEHRRGKDTLQEEEETTRNPFSTMNRRGPFQRYKW